MSENNQITNQKKEETKKCKYCQMDIPKKAKVCPNCKKKQGSKLKFFLIIIVVLAILGALGSNGDSESESNSAKNSSNQEVVNQEEKIEYLICSVDEMMDLLSSNALKAEKTYQEAYIEVTGRVCVIDSDGNYISLYPINDEWAFIGVQCYIKNEEQLNHVLNLKTDDNITVRIKCKSIGEVMGYSGDIVEFVK